jgi:hypothetical protein
MFAIMFRRTILADSVQGIIMGGLLAFFTANRITTNLILGDEVEAIRLATISLRGPTGKDRRR